MTQPTHEHGLHEALDQLKAVTNRRRVLGMLGAASPMSNLSTDNVFSDGVSLQLATVTGDATTGFAASLIVGV